MKTPFSCFFLLLCFSGAAQTLPGYVTLQNSKGQSADPAAVLSTGATATTVRSEDGFFRLVFGEKSAGQDVAITVEKTGYEVVNREALFTRLPDTTAGAPALRIFLCPQGAWRRNADKYYEVNQRIVSDNFEGRIRSAQQRLSGAEAANTALADTIRQLMAGRDAALELLKGYAEQLARTNLDDMSERYRLAFRLFSVGKLDSFLLLVREKDIRADLERVEKEISKARALGIAGREKVAAGRTLRQQTLEELLIRARALALSGAWEDADRTLGIVAREDSSNQAVLREYYWFKIGRHQHREALDLSLRMLALPGLTTSDSAQWLYHTGQCYTGLDALDQALPYYQQSAAIYKPLSKRFEYCFPITPIL